MKKYILFLVIVAFSMMGITNNAHYVSAFSGGDTSEIICPNGNTLASNCTSGKIFISPGSVVISRVNGPQSLNVNQQGTWTVSAYDRNGGNLSYSVMWGDEGSYGNRSEAQLGAVQQTATFTHSYSQTGIYIPTFTVTSQNTIRCIQAPCPSNGGSAQASLSVNVGNSPVPSLNSFYISPSDISLYAGKNVNVKAYYQPPMPPCPVGFACAQVMPAPYPVRATWAVADTNVARVSSVELPCIAPPVGTINNSYCLPSVSVTGVSAGTTVLTATYKEITATAVVTVSGPTNSSITVTFPNGGETWAKGTMQTITWQDNRSWQPCPMNANCTRLQQAYEIKLMTYPYTQPCTSDKCPMFMQLGSSRTIATRVYGSSYNWTIPNCTADNPCSSNFDIPTGAYTIQVCQSGTGVCDSSDSYFKIVNNETSTNALPVINGVPAIPVDIKPNQSVSFSWHATDADKDDLSWSVSWGDNIGSTGVCSASPSKGTGQNWSHNDTHSWAQPGTYTILVTVSDCRGGSDSRSFSVNVGTTSAPFSIVTASVLPNAKVGQAYSVALNTSGAADSSYGYWTVDNGAASFPVTGLGLSSSYGSSNSIAGTPAKVYIAGVEQTVPYTFTFNVTVTSGSQSATKQFSLTVDPATINGRDGKVKGAETFTFTRKLQLGSSGSEVLELQNFLNRTGYNAGVANGSFGLQTEAAVMQLEAAYNLKRDGIVGPKVREVLNR